MVRIEEINLDINIIAYLQSLDQASPFFFLDSAAGLYPQRGRFSFLGHSPYLTLRVWQNIIELEDMNGTTKLASSDVLADLQQILDQQIIPAELSIELASKELAKLLPFWGGAVGYFAYELGNKILKITDKRSGASTTADIFLAFYNNVIILDHQEGKSYISDCGLRGLSEDNIQSLVRLVQESCQNKYSKQSFTALGSLSSQVSKADYCKMLSRAKQLIYRGEIYQVNLAQAFEQEYKGSSLSLYKNLCSYNPAPFAAYLNCGDLQILSSSPERFFQIKNARISTSPIKGTIKRSSRAYLDRQQLGKLLASPKDRAELLMIVDLERNDLHRICKPGSVIVDELFQLQSYPELHHLEATISGALGSNIAFTDCLRALFPGGSITGAPKKIAMQVINELENEARGIYTGAIGYLGFDASVDLNIAIRTVLCREGSLSVHVGSGIVYDSHAEQEYNETILKRKAILKAILAS